MRVRIVRAAILCMVVAFLYFAAGQSENIYTITQYPQLIEAQGTCYTITDSAGHLVIVDGGFDESAYQVLQLIVANDSYVDAWILTHPHGDHIGAFENLMEGDFDFDIGVIYAIDLDEDFYRTVVNKYDGGYEYFARFQEIAADLDNLRYVHTGEHYDLCGLDMEILNAYDREDPIYEFDPANTGSIMFRLTADGGDTMLFCADVRSSMSDRIIDRWGEHLKSDNLQVSHHGNQATLPREFYEIVDPEVAFFDEPEWMTLSPDLTTLPLYEWFENRGTICYYFSNPPKYVKLK